LRIAITGALLLFAMGVGALLALRLLRPTTPATLLPGQLLAAEITQALRADALVITASGAYLPADRLILYTSINEQDRAAVRQWAVRRLEPFTERLALLPAGEQLTWMIDLATTPPTQEVLSVGVQAAADSTQYQTISATTLAATSAATADVAPAVPAAASSGVTENAVANSTATDQGQVVATAAASAPPAVSAAASATTAPVAPAVTSATPLHTSPFEGSGSAGGSEWQPIAGSWIVTDGYYQQTDNTGYDYITMLNLPPQEHFSMEARLRLIDGEMGGGFIYNAPFATVRNGAQLVDADQGGRYLRWGHYDENGAYIFDGGAPLDPGLADGDWHTLRLLTHSGQSTIWFDGQELGQITNGSTAGYLGLITSQAQMDFDDVVVTALPAAALGATAPITATTAGLSDDFANGNANSWRVLAGTWQFTDGVYQQNNTDGSDYGTITTYQGNRYRASVRTRLLEGSMGAGFYFNMAQRDDKMRSQMVSYTADGAQMQWGSFDEGGNFVFQGIADVPTGGDGDWHSLTLEVDGGAATLTVDETIVATAIPLTYASGYIGLFANHSKVAFDDFTVVTLPEGATE
jgi:hypothetical protein